MSEQFIFTDDEIQLLLEVCNEYKAEKEYVGWENVKTKYNEIREKFLEQYPQTASSAFPNSENLESTLTLKRVSSKIKNIRTKYKKARDANKKSGGGRVVLTFYDLCDKIWGSTPSVTSVPGGIDSLSEVNEENENQTEVDSSLTEDVAFSREENSIVANVSTNSSEDLSESTPEESTERGAKIAKFLKNHKTEKLSNRVSTENQMLQCYKEDLALKRKMVENMEEADEGFKEYQVNKTMDNVSVAINQSVQLLGDLARSQRANQHYLPRELMYNLRSQVPPMNMAHNYNVNAATQSSNPDHYNACMNNYNNTER